MQIIHTIAELRSALTAKRSALVPTMGNLHEGHIALVEQAAAYKSSGQTDTTVATIFVNRLQFLPHEDFDSYPRTFKSDCVKLQAAGCDVLFAPEEKELYPDPQTYQIHPPAQLADILEGEFRPGFFVGVCTVVMKLFQCVQPSVAVFGQKDYQQLMVLKNMVRQFAMPIEIATGATRRAADGLALSSRNGYLSEAERAQAVQLSMALKEMMARIQVGERDYAIIEVDAMKQLAARGWKPDYLTIRRQTDLQPPSGFEPIDHLVALAAARLGTTRLIDNLQILQPNNHMVSL